MKKIFRLAALASLTALLGGFAVASPAHAQEDNYTRQHLRRNVRDIDNDQRRLDDLYRQRDFHAARHHRDTVRRLDRYIADLRRHIEADRRDIHRDLHEYRQDRRRDRYDDRINYHSDGAYNYDDSRFGNNSDRFRNGGLPH